jgi:hypothetical protein
MNKTFCYLTFYFANNKKQEHLHWQKLTKKIVLSYP